MPVNSAHRYIVALHLQLKHQIFSTLVYTQQQLYSTAVLETVSLDGNMIMLSTESATVYILHFKTPLKKEVKKMNNLFSGASFVNFAKKFGCESIINSRVANVEYGDLVDIKIYFYYDTARFASRLFTMHLLLIKIVKHHVRAYGCFFAIFLSSVQTTVFCTVHYVLSQN